MTQIGIMIEGQDGLNWPRWQRLLQAAEDFGYQSVFRSDHFTNATGPDKDSLELWISLAYAASHTKTIEFGPLVAPITFRHPAMNARSATAVDDLSGGRLVLGMGAGWNDYEHKKFGIPFYDVSTRFKMLEEALHITRGLLRGAEPSSFDGTYYRLQEALLLPRPSRENGPPLLIGGNGPKKTLPLAAKFADEWNAVFINLETYKARRALLAEYLEAGGRAVDDIKYSLMTQVVYRPTQALLEAHLHDQAMDAGELKASGLIVGTGQEVVDQLSALVEAGVERFMLQWMEQDDIENLELLARDVLPHFAPISLNRSERRKSAKVSRRSSARKGQRVRNVPKAPKMPKAPKAPRVRRKH